MENEYFRNEYNKSFEKKNVRIGDRIHESLFSRSVGCRLSYLRSAVKRQFTKE